MTNPGNAATVRRDLAAALSQLAVQQSMAGRSAEAVATAEEVVAILRELALRSPATGAVEVAGVPATPVDRDDHRVGVRSGGLAALLAAGYGRVLALSTARVAAWRPTWPGLGRATVSAALAASPPLLAEVVLYGAAHPYALVTLDAVSWVAALWAVTTAFLLAVWRNWSLLDRAGASLDELLAESTSRERLVRWFARTQRRGRQIVVSMVAAAGACSLLYFAQPAIEDQLELGLVSYVSVGWTAFLVGNGGYWLIVVFRLSRRILRQRDLSVVWHSPASTSGIVHLSRAHSFGTVAMLALAVGVELLALRVSTYGDSPVLRAVSIAFPVVAALAALAFGVLPHWWLYLAVRDARHRVLRLLSPPASRPPVTAVEVTEAQSRVSLYRLVESSPGLPFSTGSMVEYAAAVLSTLVGTLLLIVLGVG